MSIQELINNMNGKEISTLAIYIAFKESYYKDVFEYEFNSPQIKEEYRLTYKEFQTILKDFQDRKIITNANDNKTELCDAWMRRMGNNPTSQVHHWAWGKGDDFKIGDYVQLNPDSQYASVDDHNYDKKYWTYGNPVGIKGVIIEESQYTAITGEYSFDPDWIYVWWFNNMINAYEIGCGDLIKWEA